MGRPLLESILTAFHASEVVLCVFFQPFLPELSSTVTLLPNGCVF